MCDLIFYIVKLRFVLLYLIFTILFACGSSKKEFSPEEIKKAEELREMVRAKLFKFDAKFAYPMQSNDVIRATNALMKGTQNLGGQINLSSNGDFLILDGDTAKGSLSFFGEMRNVGFSDISDNGINFSGSYTDFSNEEKKNGDKIIIQFDANSTVEQFRIRMVVFTNYKSNMIVYGSNRTAIIYTGEILPLDKDN